MFLAPMEDVTDIGFRRLCKQHGAAMVYSEFVAAEALVRNIKATVRKLTISDEERPVGIQIYGRTTEAVVEAARIVEAEAHPDIIDLNFGCPVKKVAGKGAGAGMLRNIPLMLEMTEAVVKAVDTPVTVKTRLGWDANNLVMPGLAKQLADCGVKAITIHGRTRAQMYTGEADWTLIGEAKRLLSDSTPATMPGSVHSCDSGSVPVIGNGDITSLEEADKAFDTYGVDAVMIGRATFGQPWLFNRQAHLLTIDDKLNILKQLLHTNVELIGDEYKAVLHTRRHLAATPLFKGIPNFRETRIRMLRADRVDDLEAILDEARELLVTSSPPFTQPIP